MCVFVGEEAHRGKCRQGRGRNHEGQERKKGESKRFQFNGYNQSQFWRPPLSTTHERVRQSLPGMYVPRGGKYGEGPFVLCVITCCD
ncbi:hypothetical protein PM082_024328 [Marasmius tenuissimus]|nr:hypothetical protein PM082_024328 [Marasmius tenuissimus]